MENDRLKELLNVVIDSLKEGHKAGWYNTGICGEIENLNSIGRINSEEERKLFEFVKNKKPDRDSEYVKGHYWLGGAWWWCRMREFSETREIRISFLQDLLTELG